MLLLKDEDVQRVLTMSLTLEVLEETQREIVKGDAAKMGRIDDKRSLLSGLCSRSGIESVGIEV